MPKVQVVISNELHSVYRLKIVYVGYDRAKAREVWASSVEYTWYETDEDTEIDLDLGKEEEDE